MLFTVLAIAAVIAIAVYVAKKTKSSTPPTVETFAAPSIHEEIAKTVEEAKSLTPIVDEVSKPKAKKPSQPKAKKPATPTMAAKKQAPKKPKTITNA